MVTTAALPTVQFVIGLREGVEAALIVGIIAAFVRQQGRKDALGWIWAGVATAVVVCVGIAIGLQLIGENLDQRAQEQFATVIGLVAVAAVTYMIVWMRGHARNMGKELRESTAAALATGSIIGLVSMAFLAVMREGVETAVFLVGTLQSDAFEAVGLSKTSAVIGALLGILIAALIGWGIYRGGIKLNLARFFKVTAVFLVVIAAGLVASSLHKGHEAGWINFGQSQALNLSWLIQPGADKPISTLITGLTGIQARPTVVETVGWLLYAVPMLVFVLWPANRPLKLRRTTTASATATEAAAAGNSNAA